MVFNPNYAACYDFLYHDKDYLQECDYLEKLWKKMDQKPKKILDLGCGTGGHATVLAERGFDMIGIDLSSSMLKIAREKTEGKKLHIHFVESDIGKFHLHQKVDSIIAMFAVMGYQTENDQLDAVCHNARHHLKEGGTFFFDCWHGTAVLQLLPRDKIKEVMIEKGKRLIRHTKSELDSFHQLVRIHFITQIFKDKKKVSEFSEIHLMRYFFPQEIRYFLEKAGFGDISCLPFLETEKNLSADHWNMMVIAKAN